MEKLDGFVPGEEEDADIPERQEPDRREPDDNRDISRDKSIMRP